MKKITMFIMESCPYCVRAKNYMNELYSKHPEYRDIPIEIVDEQVERERACTYNYYYVPTYYVDDVKVHEGAATMEDVENAFRKAME